MSKRDQPLRKRLSSHSDGSNFLSSSSFSSLTFKNGFDLERPIHVAQDSLFSGSSGWKDYRGFLNLAVLLLFISNGRVALENLIKYGVLVSPASWIYFISTDPWWKWPNLAMVLMSNISIFTVFVMEKLLGMLSNGSKAWKWLSSQMAFILYVCIFSLHIFLPAGVTWVLQSYPLYSVFSLSVYVVLFLKLISYAHANYWYRNMNTRIGKLKDREGNVFIYPYNLTLRNLYYFVFAPTLCYELRFPRTRGRRKSFIIKRTAEFACLTLIIIALCQQWVAPLLRNSVEPFTTMNFSLCVERVLKLAVPNHVIWLLSFYTIFHSLLNLIGEVMEFADRQFYLDFWNADTLVIFWKTWNIPVHRWALRHIYWPMVSNGFSKINAACAVFFVSAFFHEYLVSVPLHMFRFWAYLCMMAQIPLSIFTEKLLEGGRLGNIVMWLSLILGQPLAILMYVHDWYVTQYPHASNMPRDSFRCCVINDDDSKRWFVYFEKPRSTLVVTDGMTTTYEKTLTTKDRVEFAGNVSESLLEQSWQ
uniref:diacylglycerol O-acyltransferase n=1 Tax=Setaria digitata TaxID=48799 RepID=A0A915PQR6_9BILA